MARACPKCGRTFADNIFFCGFDGSITLQEQDFRDVDPRVGTEAAGFILVARIADGATSRIYEGRHKITRQRVAIKILRPTALDNAVEVERFAREFEAERSLNHKHVVRVSELGQTHDGAPFIVMEYLDGKTLRRTLDQEGALTAARWLRIAAQIAVAIEHAHSFGVVHRDLKPGNIFLCPSKDGDDVRVLDFGSAKFQINSAARITQLGTTVGSPYYMSPEQAMGLADLDSRSDVFSLAAIIYEMVTGKVAFDGDDIPSITKNVIEGPRPRVTDVANYYSKHLDDAIIAGLRRNKHERPSSVTALVQDIAAAVAIDSAVERIAETPESELNPRANPSIIPLTKSKSQTPKATSLIPKAWSDPPDSEVKPRNSITSSMIPKRRSRGALFATIFIGGLMLLAAIARLIEAVSH